jgi:hypothetical protein
MTDPHREADRTSPETNTQAANPPQQLESPGGGGSQPQASTLAMTVAGLVGGVLAWLLILQFYGIVQRGAVAGLEAGPPGGEVGARVIAATRVAEIRNLALAIGLFGMAVGGTLGIVEGFAQRWAHDGAKLGVEFGSVAGILLGAALGALGGYSSAGVGEWLDQTSVSLTYNTILVHGTAWGIAGIGIGLATGIACKNVKAALLGALLCAVAGILGAVIYSPVAALVFPAFDSDLSVPDGSLNRLAWVLLPAALMGLLSGVAVRSGSTSGPASPSSPPQPVA